MEPFNTPLKIREISLPHRAVFGPMAGFTDAPARRLMAQHGAGFTVSEMVSSRALVYGDHKTVSLLKAEPNGAPYGVQIFGEVPEIMGQAAAAVEQYAFDFLDINMGCPAPKIVSGGAGSKLMLDPDRCGRIVEEVVKNTSRPVTVKMRKGWDAEHVTAVECAKACEQAGVPFDETRYVETRFSLEDAYNAARNFFATRSDTTAVFAMSDMVAMGVIRALKDISRRVPEDVSVVGFDGVEMGKYFIPSLSTIVQPQEEIARQSVDVLLDMMEKDGSARHLTVTAAPLLRESIASPRR